MTDLHFLWHQILSHVSEGKFQRSLSVVAGLSALVSGVEVASEHYRGSYGQKIMYSPVVLCVLLAIVGLVGGIDLKVARTVLPWVSCALILDGVIGFGFHVRGIFRKPGGWRRNIVTNIVMGPPIFAPLLLTMSGMLGLVASRLGPEEADYLVSSTTLRRVRMLLIASMGVSALLNGFEALYSHYKSRFSSNSQWIPVTLSPILIVIAVVAFIEPDLMRAPLAIVSTVALLAGSVGFLFHLNGIRKRPRGSGRLFYNIIYGPPPFAPLLFAATGFLGLLAAQVGYAS